jgi:uncharacterized membrane protein (TIGR01218 family)
MSYEMKRLHKSVRYRIVNINGGTYFLDIGRSFWKLLFPFAFWLFPHTIFKVNDKKKLEEIQEQNVKGVTVFPSILGLGISLALSRVLVKISDYFIISTQLITNLIITLMTLVIFFLFIYYIGTWNKKKLYKIIDLNHLSTDKLWIRPTSIRLFFLYLSSYVVFLAGTVLCLWLFIELGNSLLLILSLFPMLFLIGCNLVLLAPEDTYGKIADPK